MNEKEIVELLREIKEKAPNEFIETIGIMKGIKLMAERHESFNNKKHTTQCNNQKQH